MLAWALGLLAAGGLLLGRKPASTGA